jgi:hypothetical protein
MAKSVREVSEFLKTNEVAAALGISCEAARLLMKNMRGVVVLPALNGADSGRLGGCHGRSLMR